MPRQLHVFARLDSKAPDPRADTLFDALREGDEGRVLELFDAPPGTDIVDLTLAERHTPELVAALHWAQEVHTHDLNPKLVLENLPYIVGGALKEVPLYVHGPWPPLQRHALRASARLGEWPGPVFASPAGEPHQLSASAQPCDPWPVLDRASAVMLPRARGQLAIEVEQGPRVAIVSLSSELKEHVRRDLRLALTTVSRPALTIEVCDEAELPPRERAELRRAAVAHIVPAVSGPDWSQGSLEAIAQGLPLVVLGDACEDPPPGAVFASASQSVDRCVSCVRSWAGYWSRGELPPVEFEGRTAWLDERLVQQAA